jgi:DNA processing protein
MSEPQGSIRACDACLARSWLLEELGGHLEVARGRIALVLALTNEELIAAVGGTAKTALRAGLAAFDPSAALARAAQLGLELICRCDSGYPQRLYELEEPPAVLHVAGGLDRFLTLVADQPVAIVGSRRATTYGLDVAASLARGLGSAGLVVISGMALGIDSAAHQGVLNAECPTVAVLPCGADRAYPRAKRQLHARIREQGAVISELPPGTQAWRWTFPARNRIIAALAAMTIVVEADKRSGSLLTAGFARSLGRPVGAVPGRVTSPKSRGPNGLLASGACLVRDAQDVLDQLYGADARRVPRDARPNLAPELCVLLAAIADGHDTAAALEVAGFPAEHGLAALASLELAGYIRREAGGRFAVRT